MVHPDGRGEWGLLCPPIGTTRGKRLRHQHLRSLRLGRIGATVPLRGARGTCQTAKREIWPAHRQHPQQLRVVLPCRPWLVQRPPRRGPTSKVYRTRSTDGDKKKGRIRLSCGWRRLHGAGRRSHEDGPETAIWRVFGKREEEGGAPRQGEPEGGVPPRADSTESARAAMCTPGQPTQLPEDPKKEPATVSLLVAPDR